MKARRAKTKGRERRVRTRPPFRRVSSARRETLCARIRKRRPTAATICRTYTATALERRGLQQQRRPSRTHHTPRRQHVFSTQHHLRPPDPTRKSRTQKKSRAHTTRQQLTLISHAPPLSVRRVPVGRRQQAALPRALLALDVVHTRRGVLAAELPPPRGRVAERGAGVAVLHGTPAAIFLREMSTAFHRERGKGGGVTSCEIHPRTTVREYRGVRVTSGVGRRARGRALLSRDAHRVTAHERRRVPPAVGGVRFISFLFFSVFRSKRSFHGLLRRRVVVEWSVEGAGSRVATVLLFGRKVVATRGSPLYLW